MVIRYPYRFKPSDTKGEKMKVHYKPGTFDIWGYYPDDFKDIPSPNITITDEAWQEAVSSGANKVDKKNKTLFCERA